MLSKSQIKFSLFDLPFRLVMFHMKKWVVLQCKGRRNKRNLKRCCTVKRGKLFIVICAGIELEVSKTIFSGYDKHKLTNVLKCFKDLYSTSHSDGFMGSLQNAKITQQGGEIKEMQ